jgi:hypothetical protein
MTKLFTLTLLISISLFARINPFETDPAYVQEAKIVKPIPIKTPLNNSDDGTRTIKINAKKVIKDKIAIKKIINKSIKKPKKLTKEQLAKLCKVEPSNKLLKKGTHKMKKVKEVFTPATYKVLPFVKIEVNHNDIKITSREKYEIINYINLVKQKKIAFDFLADTNFYTKYKKLKSPKFRSYRVGNHKEEHFFRVTIDLIKDVKKYKIFIKNNVAKIVYKK